MVKIKVIRCTYGEKFARGVMIVDGKFFGYTLEDSVRPKGVKIKGITAIQAGEYDMILSVSARFKRKMPLLLNVPNFEGIRIHGGNSHEDTDGCILVARNLILHDRIQGTLEADLTKLVESKGGKAKIEIIDTRG